MVVVPFDTLRFVMILKEAGVPEKHAEAEARALTEVLALNQKEWLTRTDFQHAIEHIRAEFRVIEQRLVASDQLQSAQSEQMEGKLTAQIEQVHDKLLARIEQVRAELTTKIEQVRAELTAKIEQLRVDLTAKIDTQAARTEQLRVDLTAKIDPQAARTEQLRVDLTAKIDVSHSELKALIQAETLKSERDRIVMRWMFGLLVPGMITILIRLFTK
jgi:hypothetical protein